MYEIKVIRYLLSLLEALVTRMLNLIYCTQQSDLTYEANYWSAAHNRTEVNSRENVQKKEDKINGRHQNPPRGRLRNLHPLDSRETQSGQPFDTGVEMENENEQGRHKVLNISIQERIRDNGCKLEKLTFNKEINKHWHANRALDEWSKLPSDVINAKTLACYKH